MEALPRINEIKDFISTHNSFTLICHVSPDGDTLGSAFALSLMLRKMGKKTQVVCHDKAPKVFLNFLPCINELKSPVEAEAFDAVITVDCADKKRTGDAVSLIENAKYTLNIDHHGTNDLYAQVNSVDKDAAATGELMFKLAEELEIELDKEIGTCIYTAIMTDTGNFSYSNTSEYTFHIASKLRKTGVDTYNINRMIYRCVPLAKLKLTALSLSKIQLKYEGKFAYSVVSRDELKAINAQDESVEGIIDNIRDIDTVELAAFIHEKAEGEFKVSLRSKTTVDVSKIAAHFSGGGHERAAGYTSSFNTAKEAEAELLGVIEREVNF